MHEYKAPRQGSNDARLLTAAHTRRAPHDSLYICAHKCATCMRAQGCKCLLTTVVGALARHACSRRQASAHTHTHARAQTQTCKHLQVLARTHTHTNTHKCTHARACTHANMHKHMRARSLPGARQWVTHPGGILAGALCALLAAGPHLLRPILLPTRPGCAPSPCTTHPQANKHQQQWGTPSEGL